jgi:hypothetical protein
MALSSGGLVYACGYNWDASWGNGLSDGGYSTGWAEVVQKDIKDVWITNAEDGRLASFFLDNDNVLWASGANSDYQLGTATSGQLVVPTRARVALPPGEYPVQLVKTGAVTAAPFLGTTCLTNKNRIYVWGNTGADILPQMGMGLARLPVLINDFYQPNQA